MDWGNYLFSFRGRINRAKYWLFALISIGVVAIAIGLVIAVGSSIPVFIVLGIVYLALLYASLAVAAKRLHDRGRTAWLLVVFYVVPAVLQEAGKATHVPAISILTSFVAFGIFIWAFVELACLRGTAGPNEYGPDPLAGLGGGPAVQPMMR